MAGTLSDRPPILHHPPALRPWAAIALGCHGNPDRCFRLGSWRTPICSRCVGLLVGYVVAAAALLAFGAPTGPRAIAAALLLLPALLDGSIQASTRYRSTTPRRLATGILAGFGQIEILGWATARLVTWAAAALAGSGGQPIA